MLACFSDSFMKEKGKWDKGGMGLKGMRRLPQHQFGHQRRRWPILRRQEDLPLGIMPAVIIHIKKFWVLFLVNRPTQVSVSLA